MGTVGRGKSQQTRSGGKMARPLLSARRLGDGPGGHRTSEEGLHYDRIL